MNYKNIDFSHPGIQLVEGMRNKGLIDNKISVTLSEQSAGIQKRCMQALQSGMIPNKEDADLLHKLEVAQAYVGAYDIENPAAKKKIVNALNGCNATGSRLMSTLFKDEISKHLERQAKKENAYNEISFKM